MRLSLASARLVAHDRRQVDKSNNEESFLLLKPIERADVGESPRDFLTVMPCLTRATDSQGASTLLPERSAWLFASAIGR